MTHANRIYKTLPGATLAMQAAETIKIDEQQFWKSETTVYTLEDGSQLAFSGPEFYVVPGGRKGEMIVELMEAREGGVEMVWYGHPEQAEPIAIDEAIADIAQMDEDAFGDGEWGEYIAQ